MAKSEQFIKLYRQIAEIPALVGGKLGKSVVQSVWSQRNLERGKSTKFIRSHYKTGDNTYHETFPVDITSELMSAVSPSEKFRVVLRDVDTKESTNAQFLEVWRSNNLIRSVDLTSLDVHGKVYTDGEFGTLEWSPDEKKILYVAEKKEPKREPINKRKKKDPKNQQQTTDFFKPEEFKQDWGEQLVGKVSSILVWYDVDSDAVILPSGLPENVCVAQSKWSPDNAWLVGIAYRTEPRKLGLIYCSNRIGTIFKYNIGNSAYAEFPLDNKSVKSPRFSPDGRSLIWLQSSAGGPHHTCMTLVRSDFPFNENSKPTVIVDKVETEIKTKNGTSFHGLYNVGFPERCWSSDGRLLLNTNQRNTVNSYIVDLESKSITELAFNDGSQLILDVKDDVLLANRRNYLRRDVLVRAKLPSNGGESEIVWEALTECEPVPGLSNNTIDYLDLEQNNDDSIRKFSAIYIGPKATAEVTSPRPLIVWPHGGPHSAFANNLSLECSMFLSLGYAVLMVNYRGSIGAGEASVQFLLGRVGTSDVSDCILATDAAIAKYPVNKDKVALVGGSHGGFLVTHLSGQYPDKFKAVVARNPVIDIASMAIVSDIPDWCHVECGKEYTQKGRVDEALLLKMRKSSPIEHAHLVKASTLLQIGTKDLRVPPSQGIEYYHRLKANGATVKMNIYDDNHPLGTVPNEMDNIISTLLWLEEHLSK